MEVLSDIAGKLLILGGYLVWPVIMIMVFLIFRKRFLRSYKSHNDKNQGRDRIPSIEKSEPESEDNQIPKSHSIDPELLKLVDVYLNLDIQNRTDRVRTKDTMAYQMADLVIRNKIPRELLTKQKNEGFVLALAATVQKYPEPDDVDLLLRVAEGIQRHHIQYRIAQAFGMLLVRKKVSPLQIEPITKLISSYMPDADAPLLHRLKHTERMLEVYKDKLTD